MEKDINDNFINHMAEEELLKLENQLCFALYVTSKEIIKKYKSLLEPFGLTYTSYITLLALYEQDHINVSDLGEKLFLDSGTLTPILKKLEANEWVIRKRSEIDERHLYIQLTPKAISLKPELAEIPRAIMCSIKPNSQNPDSALELLRVLRELMKSLN